MLHHCASLLESDRFLDALAMLILGCDGSSADPLALRAKSNATQDSTTLKSTDAIRHHWHLPAKLVQEVKKPVEYSLICLWHLTDDVANLTRAFVDLAHKSRDTYRG